MASFAANHIYGPVTKDHRSVATGIAIDSWSHVPH